MAEAGEFMTMRAVCQRGNTSTEKKWEVDVLFPKVLEGIIDTNAVDEGSAAFLTGMVHALRPEIVLETGTHRGRSTRALAEALVKTGGHLYTVDMQDYGLMTEGAIRENEKPYVTQIIGETPDVFTREPLLSLRGIEMAFLDGAHDEKGLVADLEYVDAHRNGTCFVVVDNAHDLGWPEIRNYFRTYTAHPHFLLETVCGLELIRLG